MKVEVSWNSVGNANGYTVYRSTTSGQQGASIGSTTATTLLDSNVTEGATYYYGVTASNDSGEGALSTQVSVVVIDVPEAPTNVTLVVVS